THTPSAYRILCSSFCGCSSAAVTEMALTRTSTSDHSEALRMRRPFLVSRIGTVRPSSHAAIENSRGEAGLMFGRVRSAMIDTVKAWVDRAERVVVLTGAGISTDSGIPDFRGPQGVWTKNPGAEKLASLQNYLADPDVRRRAWRSRLDSAAWRAEPNPGHR